MPDFLRWRIKISSTQKAIAQITQFKIDYTFWMNPAFVWIAGWLVWQNKKYLQDHDMKMMQMEGGLKKAIVFVFIAINVIGLGFIYLDSVILE